jgi:uncharacterized cupredoxin-like copper-binding protein
MIRLIIISMAITVGAGVMAIGYGLQAGASPSDAHALGPGTVTVEIDITHSNFAVTPFAVRPGTTVRFVVHNHDPIRHELIVGSPEVHARHEGGHEASHPPVPGEVSVDPQQTAETTYLFDRVGSLEYACHLPGHYQYGMHGWVQVLA